MTIRNGKRGDAGYSLVEMLVAMGIMSLVLGATMSGLSDAIRANDAILQSTGMNNSLRIAMDLMVRDLLQAGSGLPGSHSIEIPNGAGADPVNLPGPPDTAFTTAVGQPDIIGVIPGPGLGPTINGVATDMITILASDNVFVEEDVDGFSDNTITVGPLTPKNCVGANCRVLNITTGADRVIPGQLMMIEKDQTSTLVQVTGVNYTTRVLSFGADSLNLNQVGAAFGNLRAVNQAVPAVPAVSVATAADAMRITRVRMISYYLDTEVPRHPRLIRRVNNGDANTFDNTLGTAVAMDVENLQFTYDLSDGDTNPTNVRFTAADLAAGLDPRSIRKVNISLTGRSKNAGTDGTRSYRNTLTTQVSLRGMSFLDRYMEPAQ